MEFLLTQLPAIFCYLSGVLVAWSGLVMFNLIHIFRNAKKQGRKVRQGDMFHAVMVFGMGFGLLVALFAVPNWTARVMDVLFVLDCWYLAFLISVTTATTKSHFAIKEGKKVPTLHVVESSGKTKLV